MPQMNGEGPEGKGQKQDADWADVRKILPKNSNPD